MTYPTKSQFVEWGRAGGLARAKALSKPRRQAIARKAGKTPKRRK